MSSDALPKPSRWRVLEPDVARLMAWGLYLIVAWAAWVFYWPESWSKFKGMLDALAPLGAILFVGFIPAILLEVVLLERWGKLGADGKVRMSSNPRAERLENIEAAINRLHDYVKSLDPDLDEERRLQEEFFGGDGMFAGMNLHEYTRDRQAAGKRTLSTSIWRDMPEPREAQAADG